jgi:hypothetical protein
MILLVFLHKGVSASLAVQRKWTATVQFGPSEQEDRENPEHRSDANRLTSVMTHLKPKFGQQLRWRGLKPCALVSPCTLEARSPVTHKPHTPSKSRPSHAPQSYRTVTAFPIPSHDTRALTF